jgi:hypothetical protein
VYLVDDDEGSRSYFNAVLSTAKCDVLPRRVGISTLVAGRQIRSETNTWFQEKLEHQQEYREPHAEAVLTLRQ